MGRALTAGFSEPGRQFFRGFAPVPLTSRPGRARIGRAGERVCVRFSASSASGASAAAAALPPGCCWAATPESSAAAACLRALRSDWGLNIALLGSRALSEREVRDDAGSGEDGGQRVRGSRSRRRPGCGRAHRCCCCCADGCDAATNPLRPAARGGPVGGSVRVSWGCRFPGNQRPATLGLSARHGDGTGRPDAALPVSALRLAPVRREGLPLLFPPPPGTVARRRLRARLPQAGKRPRLRRALLSPLLSEARECVFFLLFSRFFCTSNRP